MSNVLLDADTLALVNHLAQLQEQRAEIEQTEAGIKARLRERLAAGETGVDPSGNRRVQLRPNRRFSADKAAEVLPPNLLTLCSVTRIDSGLARRTLAPALYEACEQVYDPSVVLL